MKPLKLCAIALLCTATEAAAQRSGCGYLLRCTEIPEWRLQLERMEQERREQERLRQIEEREREHRERERKLREQAAAADRARYRDLLRQPDKYQGILLKFTGKVVQSVQHGDLFALRVNINRSGGVWVDTIWVDYVRPKHERRRIVDDDLVSLRGRLVGIKSYVSIAGQTIQIPHIIACDLRPEGVTVLTAPANC